MGQRVIESFKTIVGYPRYEVSNHGRIRRADNGRILKAPINNGKYHRIGLSKDGNQSHYFVHRLVAEHFIPNPLGLPQVNHIDGVKTNNYVENLEWVTMSGNMIHAYETGLSDRGEKHYYTTLTNAQALEIYDMAWNGHRPKDIAEKFGILATTVGNIKSKRSWKHIHANGVTTMKQTIEPLTTLEARAIRQAIRVLDGNLAAVAKALGIGRMTLYRKIKQYNIEVT